MNLRLTQDEPFRTVNGALDAQTAMDAIQPFASLRFLVEALRSRKRVLLAAAAGGFLAALSLSLFFPPSYSATTMLLLRHSAQSDPARAMATDAELLKTETVARRAINRLGIQASARELVASYRILPVSDDLLRLTVNGPTAGQAMRRAQTVAEEFLAFRGEEFERQSRAVVEKLEQRQAELLGEATSITDRINSFSSTTGQRSDAAVRELGDLLTRRALISDQISQLRQQVASAVLDPALYVERSRILDPASEDDRSPLRALAANAGAGTVGGLALGAGFVLMQQVGSDRVRRREEVLTELGAPVAVSMGPLGGSLRAQRRRFRRQLAKPRREIADLTSSLRHVVSRSDIGPSFIFISLESDAPSALAVGCLAADLTKEGKRVLVADLTNHASLAKMFRVRVGGWTEIREPGAGSSFRLAVPPLDWSKSPTQGDGHMRIDALRGDADVILVLATLDPALGAAHLKKFGITAVAVVTAGRSTKTVLRAASQMVRGAGLEIQSVVLVNADPNDKTVGIPYGSRAMPSVGALPIWTNP